MAMVMTLCPALRMSDSPAGLSVLSADFSWVFAALLPWLSSLFMAVVLGSVSQNIGSSDLLLRREELADES